MTVRELILKLQELGESAKDLQVETLGLEYCDFSVIADAFNGGETVYLVDKAGRRFSDRPPGPWQ